MYLGAKSFEELHIYPVSFNLKACIRFLTVQWISAVPTHLHEVGVFVPWIMWIISTVNYALIKSRAGIYHIPFWN